MELPRPSDLTATQQAAILAAEPGTHLIPQHFPRVTIRALFMRQLATRAEHNQVGGLIPARLTLNGQAMKYELEDQRDARRARR